MNAPWLGRPLNEKVKILSGGARNMRAAKIKFQHFGKLHDSTVLFFVIASCTAATKELVCSTTVLDCPLDVKADTVQVLEFPTEAC